MKKIILLFIILLSFSFSWNSIVYWEPAGSNTETDNLETKLTTVTNPNWILNSSSGATLGGKAGLFAWAKNQIVLVVEVLAVWVFIFIGIRFVMARWNPEEFKKAWLHFVYAIIWVFFIFMAWWAVKLVSSIRI
jgi:hypothetical protein